MFTGIIQELGSVREIKRTGSVHALAVDSDGISRDAKIGDSVAVNGVCLTVVNSKKNTLTFEIMDESIRKTNLALLKSRDKVNLESALLLGDKISGHMTSGHIDGTGRIRVIKKVGETMVIEIEMPLEFARFIVPKGSIAIDGISLTVGEIRGNCLSVHIIPHTFNSTCLKYAKHGDLVNVELDLMAKYAQKRAREASPLTESFLREHGFV